MVSDDAIRELCNLTTHDHAGRHFTTYAEHWEELEAAGLVVVNRPVHEATGIPYAIEHWTIEVTDAGQDLVDCNPELQPED